MFAGIIRDQVIKPYFFDKLPDGEIYSDFLRDDLPDLLGDLPIDTKHSLYYHYDRAFPHQQNRVFNRWHKNI